MNRTFATRIALIVTAVLTATAAAQDGESPPAVRVVGWEVQQQSSGFTFTVFDEDLGIGSRTAVLFFPHEELDRVTVTIAVTDPDWILPDPDEQGDDDREYFVRLDFLGAFFGYPPDAPPIRATNPDLIGPEYHGGADGEGFSPPLTSNVATLSFSFRIPEFIGKNQARLRGDLPWDVAWDLRIRVSNEESPAEDTVVGEDVQGFGALESPLLPPSNPPPFPDAGPDQTVATGTVVTLDASRTFEGFNTGFDPDDENVFEKDNIQFVWEYISCTCGLSTNAVNIVHDSLFDPTARVRLDATGEYVFRVSVDDGFNPKPKQDSVVITVLNELPVNNPPSARITGPASAVPLGATVTLTAEASSDPDGDELTYLWRQTNELGQPLDLEEVRDVFQPIVGTQSAAIMWQTVTEGTFYFRLLVSDGEFVSTSRFTVEVIEPATAGLFLQAPPASDDAAGAEADAAADLNNAFAPIAPLCGAGLLLAALAPLALLLARRRR